MVVHLGKQLDTASDGSYHSYWLIVLFYMHTIKDRVANESNGLYNIGQRNSDISRAFIGMDKMGCRDSYYL